MKENLRLFVICFVACGIAVAIAGLLVKAQVQQQVDSAKSTPVGSLLNGLFGSKA
ncbi:MAG: hypothetical protein ACXWKG_19025 [Limisphaerales bacterium]